MKKTMTPRVGVALSGGSALGIAHVGILKSLREHHVPIDCIAGTSAGAIVAACYAFNVPLDTIVQKARGLSWYAMSKLSFSGMGLVSHAAFGKMINEFLGDVQIEDAAILLAIIATDVETGERVVFREGSLTDALMASTCIPGLFVPVEVGGRLMVDGGLVDNLPISALREMRAQVMIGVDVNRRISKKRPKNVLDVVVKSFEIATAYRHPLGEKEILIEPHLEAFSPSDFGKADQLVDAGYRAATLKMREIRNLTEKGISKAGLWKKISSWFRA